MNPEATLLGTSVHQARLPCVAVLPIVSCLSYTLRAGP